MKTTCMQGGIARIRQVIKWEGKKRGLIIMNDLFWKKIKKYHKNGWKKKRKEKLIKSLTLNEFIIFFFLLIVVI